MALFNIDWAKLLPHQKEKLIEEITTKNPMFFSGQPDVDEKRMIELVGDSIKIENKKISISATVATSTPTSEGSWVKDFADSYMTDLSESVFQREFMNSFNTSQVADALAQAGVYFPSFLTPVKFDLRQDIVELELFGKGQKVPGGTRTLQVKYGDTDGAILNVEYIETTSDQGKSEWVPCELTVEHLKGSGTKSYSIDDLIDPTKNRFPLPFRLDGKPHLFAFDFRNGPKFIINLTEPDLRYIKVRHIQICNTVIDLYRNDYIKVRNPPTDKNDKEDIVRARYNWPEIGIDWFVCFSGYTTDIIPSIEAFLIEDQMAKTTKGISGIAMMKMLNSPGMNPIQPKAIFRLDTGA